MDYKKIKTKEDIPKLHNEMLQLRKQQFLLGTAGLTAVGFSSWIIPEIENADNSSDVYTIPTIIIFIILTGLFIWSCELRRLIGTISAYLKLKGASDWEIDFYKFSTDKIISYVPQTLIVALFYLILGIVLLANILHVSLYLIIALIVYIILVLTLCLLTIRNDGKVTQKWESLINKCNQKPKVWGVLMETSSPEAIVNLITFSDGTTRIHFSNGTSLTGLEQHEQLRTIANQFFEESQTHTELFTMIDRYPLPKEGHARFYLLTFNGILMTEANEKKLNKNKSALSPLFLKGQELINQARNAKKDKEN